MKACQLRKINFSIIIYVVLDNSSTYNLPHAPGEVVGPWVVGAGASVGA